MNKKTPSNTQTRLVKSVIYLKADGSYAINDIVLYEYWLWTLTDGISSDGAGSTARCSDVTGSCTGEVELSRRQRYCSSRGLNDSTISVSPHVTRLGVTIRHTGQIVTRLERRLSGRCDGYCSRTIYRQKI